jgi:hypothetical protein
MRKPSGVSIAVIQSILLCNIYIKKHIKPRPDLRAIKQIRRCGMAMPETKIAIKKILKCHKYYCNMHHACIIFFLYPTSSNWSYIVYSVDLDLFFTPAP